ncbi:MAG: phosphatidate cytidylyltransferase [Acidobacteriota bacterium]
MKRILTAVILIALVAALIYFDKHWMITAFAAVIALLAVWEFRQMCVECGNPIPIWWTVGAVLLFFAVAFRAPQVTIAALSFSTLLLFVWSAFRSPLECVLAETATGLFLLLYIAYPLTLIPQFLIQENGTALLLFLLICVWSGDIAALYIGKRYGKRKLAPRLSPNKTWAGAVASVVASVLFGLALIGLGEYLSTHTTFTRLHTSEPWWQTAILAVVLNIAAQLGDLVESALKRAANIKDSGTLLPGHGGVLDRIDALLVAAPVLWFFLAAKDYFSLGSF